MDNWSLILHILYNDISMIDPIIFLSSSRSFRFGSHISLKITIINHTSGLFNFLDNFSHLFISFQFVRGWMNDLRLILNIVMIDRNILTKRHLHCLLLFNKINLRLLTISINFFWKWLLKCNTPLSLCIKTWIKIRNCTHTRQWWHNFSP